MILGEGNGTPLQCSCLENPMDGGAWWAAVHGVAKSWTRLSDFTFTFYFHALEKEIATHSSVLAWRIPGTGEPGGLPSLGSHRVRHDWSDLAAVSYVRSVYSVNKSWGLPCAMHTFYIISIFCIFYFIYFFKHLTLLLQVSMEKNIWFRIFCFSLPNCSHGNLGKVP